MAADGEFSIFDEAQEDLAVDKDANTLEVVDSEAIDTTVVEASALSSSSGLDSGKGSSSTQLLVKSWVWINSDFEFLLSDDDGWMDGWMEGL
jgi:hypothetical protein